MSALKMKKKLEKTNPKDIDMIVDFLCLGKTIVYPTDTIYGLGCLAVDKKAIEKVKRIKKRDKNKPLLVLISDLKMLGGYFKVNAKQRAYLKKVWPGPVSVILNKKKGVFPDELSGGSEGVAVRLPKNTFLIKMIKAAGAPVVSTSLNKSGEEPLASVQNVEKYFTDPKPDLIVDAGELRGRPSRLVDLRDADKPVILRK